MLNSNDTLPKNLQELNQKLAVGQAVPIGNEGLMPFLMVKLPASEVPLLAENKITCEFKPSIFNIGYKDENVALCIVQFRLNGSSQLVYTASYDLKNDKHYRDVSLLLAMDKYALLVVSDEGHDFLQFEANFEADFKPLAMLDGARTLGSDYEPGLFLEVSHAITSQAATPAQLWSVLDEMAPFDKSWYGAMQMGATKI